MFRAFLASLCLIVPLAFAAPAVAQSTATDVHGTVLSPNGAPVGGADVVARGPQTAATRTDPKGGFSFSGLTPGIYQVTVTKGGFLDYIVDGVAVVAGSATSLPVSLTVATLNSLTEIGRVRVSAQAARINTSSAAIVVMTNEQIQNQGAQSVDKILNEIPGIQSVPVGSSGSTPAAPLAKGQITIRGALPVESAELIDGHRIASGYYGFFTPSFLPTFAMQGVESVQGPGGFYTQIANAINGSVNIRTLEPTKNFRMKVDYGVDGYGGQFSDWGATGSALNGKIGFAFAYSVRGNPGPFQNQQNYTISDNVYQFNGVVQPNGTIVGLSPVPSSPRVIGSTANGGSATTSAGPLNSGIADNQTNLYSTLLLCCANNDTRFTDHGGLGKLRFNLSSATTLTLSYFGQLSTGNVRGSFGNEIDGIFNPGAGYTGPLPATPNPTSISPFLAQQPGTYPRIQFISPIIYENDGVNVFQADLRTSLRKDTVLARFYGFGNLLTQYSGDVGSPIPYSPIVTAYGTWNAGAPYGTQVFNGVPISISYPIASANTYTRIRDRTFGYALEYDHPAGNHLLSISEDIANLQTYGYSSAAALGQGVPPAGTSEIMRTAMLRDIVQLGPKLEGTIAGYYSTYLSNIANRGPITGQPFSTFQTISTTHLDPRAALVYRPDSNTSVRFAVGSSIAPLALSNFSPGGLPFLQPGGTFFAQSIENFGLKPETSFGYNFGFDRRLGDGQTIVSMDAYTNTLQNQEIFARTSLGNITVTGTATCACGVPIGTTVTAPDIVAQPVNIGHARYNGIEFSLTRAPRSGWGGTIQGALMQAYPYGLPCTFWTSDGTCTGTLNQNLAIIPNQNYQHSGIFGTPSAVVGFTASVPYSMGYGEISYTHPNGARFSIGETYVGNNNQYGVPAFAYGNLNIGVPLVSKSTRVQFSVDNLWNTNSNLSQNGASFNAAGVPEVLKNGQVALNEAYELGPRTIKMFLSHTFGK